MPCYLERKILEKTAGGGDDENERLAHADYWDARYSQTDDTLANTGDYLREVARVLKPGGVFQYVTYRQPHFVRPLLQCEGTDWDMTVEVLGYHGIVCKSKKSA